MSPRIFHPSVFAFRSCFPFKPYYQMLCLLPSAPSTKRGGHHTIHTTLSFKLFTSVSFDTHIKYIFACNFGKYTRFNVKKFCLINHFFGYACACAREKAREKVRPCYCSNHHFIVHSFFCLLIYIAEAFIFFFLLWHFEGVNIR